MMMARVVSLEIDGLISKSPFLPDFVSYRRLHQQAGRCSVLRHTDYGTGSWQRLKCVAKSQQTIV